MNKQDTIYYILLGIAFVISIVCMYFSISIANKVKDMENVIENQNMLIEILKRSCEE